MLNSWFLQKEKLLPWCWDPAQLKCYTGNCEHSSSLTTSLHHCFQLSNERTVQLPGCSLSSFQRYFCLALQRQNCPFGDEGEKFFALWGDEMMWRTGGQAFEFVFMKFSSSTIDNVVIRYNWHYCLQQILLYSAKLYTVVSKKINAINLRKCFLIIKLKTESHTIWLALVVSQH